MNVFSFALSKVASIPKSGIGVRVCLRSPLILCLFFADDSLLFYKTSVTASSNLKKIINNVCTLSGQLINFHKSTLVFSRNATRAHKQTVAAIFIIPQHESLKSYLGCLTFQCKPKATTFTDILAKATTKTESWKANSLSKAGRTVLIQSNQESLPAQCFKLPKQNTKALGRVHKEFFWKKSNTDKGLTMIAWDIICQPKKLGGLGLRKIKAVNLAFQCKLTRKILHEKDLGRNSERQILEALQLLRGHSKGRRFSSMEKHLEESYVAKERAKMDSWYWRKY